LFYNINMPEHPEASTEELPEKSETVESIAPEEKIDVTEFRVAEIIKETQDPVETWSACQEDYYKAVQAVYGCLSKISKGDVAAFDEDGLAALGYVLTAWKFAATKADELHHTHPSERDFEADAFWDSTASRIGDDLGAIFDPDMSNDMSNIVKRLNLASWETPIRTDVAEQLLTNPDFEQKGILTEYMAYKVWLAYQPVTFQSYSDEAQRDPETGKTPGEIRAEQERLAYSEVLSLGLVESAKAGDSREVKKAMGFLLSSGAKDIADKALGTEDFDEGTRQQFTIDYINTFGFIPCVEVLSPLAKTRPEFKKLYETIHGQEVEEVMAALSEVYTKSLNDFISHYAPETTKHEVGLVRTVLSERIGKSLEEATVIDLAAGFGRVSLGLIAEGCQNVVSVEPQGEFHDRLEALAREQDGKMQVIQGVWDKLTELGIEHADLGVCVGRSLPHANTLPKLTNALSQMTSICETWLVDFPDPSVGVYKERADRLYDSLVRLGVDPEKTSMIHDSPDGRHFFNRMVVNESQLKMLGELLGFTVEVVDEDLIGENKDIRNVYYLLKKDSNFDITKLCGDRLMAITADLGLRRPGIDFNMYIPAWGMSLGQALIYSHEDPAFRDAKIASVIRNNARYGVPKVSVEFDENGILYLGIMRRGTH